MSTTLQSRPQHLAMQDALAFRALFPKQFWARWEFAGSLRRQRPYVGDIEHVVIPIMTSKTIAGLFDQTKEDHNTLWDRVDELVKMGTFSKHVYHTKTRGDQFRWGPRYRGIDFRGFNHEVFIADAANWGSALAIRTGPAEYSQKVVAGLLKHGHANRGGYVRDAYRWDCVRCHATQGDANWDCSEDWLQDVHRYLKAEKEGMTCHVCGDLMQARVVPVADESKFFELAGLPMLPPERRMP